MRRFGLGLMVLLTGCFDFEGALKGRCLDGGFVGGNGCERFRDGGGSGGGGGGGTTPWRGDGGPMCTEDQWCWENGGADLFVLFGTTDTDVWAAGTGGTLIHWNGTRWEQARSLLPRPTQLDALEAEPVFRSTMTTATGDVWLVGERTPILVRQTTPEFSGAGGVYGYNLLATWKGSLYGLSSRFVDFAEPQVQGPLLNYDTFHSMLVNDEGCFVAVERGGAAGPDFRGVVDCQTDTVRLDTTGDGGGFSDAPLALFSLADAGLGATGRHGNVFLRDGQGQWLETTVLGYLDQSFRDNYGELAAATRVGDQVWVAGRLGGVFKLTGPTTSTAVRVPNYNEADLSTAWTSRNGTFWAAGYGGVVVRIDAGTVAGPSTALPAYPVVDLWADPQQQVAVLSNADLLVRDAGSATWSRKRTNTAVNWVAGTGWGGRMFLLGTNGQLYQWPLTASDPVIIGPFLDAGITPTGVRSGAFGPVGDGRFVIGAAGVVGVFDARDGGLTRLADSSSPNGPSRIVGVARLSDGRTLVAGNRGPFENEQGGLYEVGDGGWTMLSSTAGALEHLARCPNDSVVVVGQREFSARYQAGWTPLRTNPTTLHVFNSAWCDMNNDAWVLSQTGKVFHYTGTSESIELTGWGANADSQFEANLITGNARTVFVAGGKTAILTKTR